MHLPALLQGCFNIPKITVISTTMIVLTELVIETHAYQDFAQIFSHPIAASIAYTIDVTNA